MRNERGITLLILVITIVITMILAVVTISFALKENGLFSNMEKTKIMNKVQSLDDTIKAYTFNNKDPYASSRKTVQDLVSEGMLIKLQLDGKKAIFYVTDDGLQTLGLKFKNNTSIEKIQADGYSKIEDLQKYGIYVVDNKLNAAYLYKSKTYGKLLDFGDKSDIANNGSYNGKIINIYPQQVQDSEQEVIFVIDRTVSMACDVEKGTTDSSSPIPIKYNDDGSVNYTEGYKQTRWHETVLAMDAFIDKYLPSGNIQKKLTIYTYSGQNNALNIQKLGTFTNAGLAKLSYANIFTQEQYEKLLHNAISGKYDQSKYGNYFKTYTEDGQTKYYLDCRLANPKYNQVYDIDAPTLGYGTCTPNALKEVYEYIAGKKQENIPMDVIIMTDGDTNTYSGIPADKTQTGNYAGKIMDISIKNHQTGVYAIGFSPDAGNFESDFTYGGKSNITGYYSAANAGSLIDSFETIFEDVNKESSTIITDGALSDTYDNVFDVKIEVYDSENKTGTLKVFEYTAGGIYDLNNIYTGSEINLKAAFEAMDAVEEITAEYNKIDVYIMYYVGSVTKSK